MMPTTEPAPVRLADVQPAPPRCQVLWECSDKCGCPPTRCHEVAEYRVSFRCVSASCDHAGDLVLMCERCTRRADDLGTVLARRPL